MAEIDRRQFFTTGEFAKICNTTKETLFHYDEIGLLTPHFVGENRYRYYSPRQFYLYDLIDTLKSAGCSLSEIKEYMTRYDPHSYMKLLDRCCEKLEQKRKEIDKIQKILENSKNSVMTALEIPVDEPYLEACDEEMFVITPVTSDDEYSDVYSLQEHFAYCTEHDVGDEFTIGSIMIKEDMQKGIFAERYFYSKISEPVEPQRFYRKSAGDYVSMLHKGTYEALPKACRRLLDFIGEQGYDLGGNGYVYDQISYFATREEKNFVIKVSLEVSVR